jgi:hypothetical protein
MAVYSTTYLNTPSSSTVVTTQSGGVKIYTGGTAGYAGVSLYCILFEQNFMFVI